MCEGGGMAKLHHHRAVELRTDPGPMQIPVPVNG
jgi:hypothetical protein